MAEIKKKKPLTTRQVLINKEINESRKELIEAQNNFGFLTTFLLKHKDDGSYGEEFIKRKELEKKCCEELIKYNIDRLTYFKNMRDQHMLKKSKTGEDAYSIEAVMSDYAKVPDTIQLG